MRVLIAGVSVRAAAASAARAGFAVTSLDAYGDADAHPAVRALSVGRDLGRRYSARTAARLSRAIECDAVAYLSNFENDVVALQVLADGRMLLGNGPEIVRRARDPRLLAEAFRREGLPAPRLLDEEPPSDEGNPPRGHEQGNETARSARAWMCKPLQSGGGRRVRRWTGQRMSAGCYLQEQIDGTPGSVTFVAARGKACVLAISRQLVGDRAFGVSRYRYCGNIFAPVDQRLRQGAEALAQCAADAFGLVGLNGIDFVERDGVPYPIELNPRWSASMEIVERRSAASLFELHVEACLHGRLPAMAGVGRRDWAAPFIGGGAGAAVHGKAIVFAREVVTVRDSHRWLDDPEVADVPHAGERILAGAPVCTVFASAPSGEACLAALRQKAAGIYVGLGTSAGRCESSAATPRRGVA
jgi:uncharacterized protein